MWLCGRNKTVSGKRLPTFSIPISNLHSNGIERVSVSTGNPTLFYGVHPILSSYSNRKASKVIVGADFEADDSVHILTPSGENQNRTFDLNRKLRRTSSPPISGSIISST